MRSLWAGSDRFSTFRRAITDRVEQRNRMMRTLASRLSLGSTLLVLVATSSRGTVYWTPEDAAKAKEASLTAARPELPPPTGAKGSDYPADFIAAVWFIAGRQVTDAGDPNYGGIREAEHLPDIVQTDNTSESIWMFSRYYELTGDAAIIPYLERSWTYVLNFPAYGEEGSEFPSTGYYRYYNCGWAVRAGMKYAEVFGEEHKVYVDSCATYLATHNLSLDGSTFHQNVNPPVLAWSAGNLRRYAVAEADSMWKLKAWKRGERVRDWVDTDPAILSREEWAMSGGAVTWGVLESYFAEFPAEEAAWVATYASVMDTVASPGVWENAWNAWYALSQKRLQESTGDPTWGQRHLTLTDYLLGFDTDLDGGIPASPADADTMDQSWVTAYLGFMGFEPLLSAATGAPSVGLPALERPFALMPNRPNPFRPETTIPFRLAQGGHVVLEILSPAGRKVARLLDREVAAGEHFVRWDGRDERGRPVASGIYFYRLEANRRSESRKLIFVK